MRKQIIQLKLTQILILLKNIFKINKNYMNNYKNPQKNKFNIFNNKKINSKTIKLINLKKQIQVILNNFHLKYKLKEEC